MCLKSVWYCRVQVSSHVKLNGFHSYFNNGLRQRNDSKEFFNLNALGFRLRVEHSH